ncbi:MAG: CsiV family protein [Woeseiaceae bacterium]
MRISGVMAGLALSVLSVPAPAQVPAEPPGETAEEPRRYTVELIVFEHTEPGSGGNELFRPEAPEPGPAEPAESDDAPVVYSDTDPAASAAPAGKTALEELPLQRRVEFYLLEPEAYTMCGVWDKLEQLDAYRPLFHTGWTQATRDRDESPAIRLRSLGRPPLTLDGSLTLYLSRYLHLVVDLSLDAGDGAAPPGAPGAAGYPAGNGDDWPPGSPSGGYFGEPEPWRHPLRYRIAEDRIFRTGELRYFDHPKFGVIVRVNRHEDAMPGDDAAAGAVAAGSGQR